MRNRATDKYFTSTVIRRYRKVAAFAVLVIVLVTLILSLPTTTVVAPQTVEEFVEVASSTTEVATDAYVLQAAYPNHIRIPKIGVDAAFESPLGIDENREIETPETYETVAYYKYGPTPGELGPSVVLGHVDSYQGPAVFYSLGQLEAGDTIEIDREDGSTAVFEVERLERHTQNGFPTEKVYGALDYAGLRLITCTGTYDRGIQRYSHNLIVFARLIEPKETEKNE